MQTYTNDVPGRTASPMATETVDGTHCLIVVEATGGLEQAVISDLLLADYPVAKINPKRARVLPARLGLFTKQTRLIGPNDSEVYPLKDAQQIELSIPDAAGNDADAHCGKTDFSTAVSSMRERIEASGGEENSCPLSRTLTLLSIPIQSTIDNSFTPDLASACYLHDPDR